MDVYQQAARAMQASLDGKGQLKRLCLQKEVQKKRATYAVAAETSKHVKVVDDVLKGAGFYEQNPTFWPCLARVMCYDALFGTGLKGEVRKGAGYAVKKHMPRFKKALQELMKRQKVRDPKELIEKRKPRIPIYVRVNTVVTTVTDVVAAFVASGWRQMDAPDPDAVLEAGRAHHYQESDKRKREDAPEDEEPAGKKAKTNDGKALKKKGKKKKGKDAEDDAPPPTAEHDRKVFYRDPMLTSLLVFPPSSKFALIKHDVIRTHRAVIQDKASCLPPYVLLHCLPMVSALDRQNPDEATAGTTFMGPVMDATSAPGNKTSLLAALSRGKRQVYAIEKDEARAELLQRRLNEMKSPKVEVVNKSFLDIYPEEYPQVEGILLDPSCSGSGIVDRIDDNLKTDKDKDDDKNRLERLSEFQHDMIIHAMTFPSVRRIVYSTCSVHREENEEVVKRVMDADDTGRWRLADIMPGTWGNRALPVFQNAQHCIRCSPTEDHTNGFFVACFEKVPKSKKKSNRLSRAEKKRRKKAKLEAENGENEEGEESDDEVEVVVENASDNDDDAVVETSARGNNKGKEAVAAKPAAKAAKAAAVVAADAADDDDEGEEEEVEEFEELEEDAEEDGDMEEIEEVEELEESEEAA